MMKTMIVVRYVSFQLGQVTFQSLRDKPRDGTATRPVRFTGTAAGKSLPALSAVFFVASATLLNPFLRHLAGVEGLEPPAYGFGDRRSTN